MNNLIEKFSIPFMFFVIPVLIGIFFGDWIINNQDKVSIIIGIGGLIFLFLWMCDTSGDI